MKFRVDVAKAGYPVPEELLKRDALDFVADRGSHHPTYMTQLNSGPGSYGTYSQSKPPHWDNTEEAYWLTSGRFEIEGLDPELAYSARLVEARWVAPNGEVIVYDRPAGTNSIGNSTSVLPAPLPTSARLNALLGEPPETDRQYVNESTGGTQILLFGGWTSEYERYKTTPGRLELRVGVDLYRHDIGQRVPLVSAESSAGNLTDFQLMSFEASGNELEVLMQKCSSAKRWSVPIEERWTSWLNWIIYSPETGQRARAAGSGYSYTTLLHGFQLMKSGPSFRSDIGRSEEIPDLSKPEALVIIRIQPHYLGSTVVDIVIEDFSLVSQKSIEHSER
jgi:hypothetical protein